jgi:hypothetical protein
MMCCRRMAAGGSRRLAQATKNEGGRQLRWPKEKPRWLHGMGHNPGLKLGLSYRPVWARSCHSKRATYDSKRASDFPEQTEQTNHERRPPKWRLVHLIGTRRFDGFPLRGQQATGTRSIQRHLVPRAPCRGRVHAHDHKNSCPARGRPARRHRRMSIDLHDSHLSRPGMNGLEPHIAIPALLALTGRGQLLICSPARLPRSPFPRSGQR